MGGKCYRKGGEGRAAWLFREGVLYPEAGNVQYSAGLDLIAVWARGSCCIRRLKTCGTVQIAI